MTDNELTKDETTTNRKLLQTVSKDAEKIKLPTGGPFYRHFVVHEKGEKKREQSQIHGYPSRVRVNRSSAGENHFDP